MKTSRPTPEAALFKAAFGTAGPGLYRVTLEFRQRTYLYVAATSFDDAQQSSASFTSSRSLAIGRRLLAFGDLFSPQISASDRHFYFHIAVRQQPAEEDHETDSSTSARGPCYRPPGKRGQ